MENQYKYQTDDRIRQQHAKVQEVVGIMKDNVNRVLERESRLAEIDTRADELQKILLAKYEDVDYYWIIGCCDSCDYHSMVGFQQKNLNLSTI
ncbi:unnamed protein product [Heterobilharzia americana]|nr:unnamed protein product [Heterobilharzia americana]